MSVDSVAAVACVLGLVGIFWVWLASRRIPGGNRFLCTQAIPQSGSPRLVILASSAVWAVGAGLWLGGRVMGREDARIFGMIVLLSALMVWPRAWTLVRQLKRSGASLSVRLDDPEGPHLELEAGGDSRRVALVPGSVRAWTVGNGIAGPQYLQLAAGPDATTGIALFVAPKLGQWKLSDGASWLASCTGWAPVARGSELVALLAPYIVPGDEAMKAKRVG